MTPILLGSGSAIRARILINAGVPFTVERPRVDEDALKAAWAGTPPAEVARRLADAKALEVSGRYPGALVIGADQTMEHRGRLLDKPRSETEARARLSALQSDIHRLHSGVSLTYNREIVARHAETSTLAMRALSEAFLDDYAARAGEALTATVGGYEYEGLGAQLFERVEGDYFAVLGLPLLPVLAMLRAHGGLAE